MCTLTAHTTYMHPALQPALQCCAIVHQMTKNCQICSVLRPEVATAGDVVLRAPAIAGSGEAGSGEGAPAMLDVMLGVLVGVAVLPLSPELAIKAPAHNIILASSMTQVALTVQRITSLCCCFSKPTAAALSQYTLNRQNFWMYCRCVTGLLY